MSIPEDRPSMGQMVHALAEFFFLPNKIHTSPMTSGIYGSHGPSRHLKALDLLSVLLVTESARDAAAISIYRAAADHIEVWYSKGRPCTEAENADIVNFIRSAVHATPVSRPATEYLLRIALNMCKRKVFARIYQARQHLLPLCLNHTYGIIPRGSRADRGIRTAAKRKLRRLLGSDDLPHKKPLEDFLTKWFQEIILVIRLDIPFDITANVGFYFKTVVRCYALLQLSGIDTVIESTLLERLRKIAEYYTAVSTAHREVQKLSPGGKACLIRSIREIPPPTPTTGLTPLDPFTCLSRWARHRGLSLHFPSLPPPTLPALPTQIPIAECTHPEATLITKIISAHKSSLTVLRNIGSSEASCWICQEFLSAAHGLYPDICIRLLRQNIATAESWKFPVDTPVELALVLTGRIERAMGKVLEGFNGANGVNRKDGMDWMAGMRGVKRRWSEVEGQS